MKTRLLLTLSILCVVIIPAAIIPAMAASCESLSSLTLPDTTITLAQVVAPGEFHPPTAAAQVSGLRDFPAFCRVTATLKPTNDSDIKIEVWLPASGWNGKFQAVGNGGWAGVISYLAMAQAVAHGYATASTDTGHVGASGSFALGHPEKLTDFGYRAVHEMTVKAKAIIGAFYGDAPKLSYWNGCSTGGRQGLKEAQRFPNDYDGIVAGAPPIPEPVSRSRLCGSHRPRTKTRPATFLRRSTRRSTRRCLMPATRWMVSKTAC
jgi:feruloyl esterase